MKSVYVVVLIVLSLFAGVTVAAIALNTTARSNSNVSIDQGSYDGMNAQCRKYMNETVYELCTKQMNGSNYGQCMGQTDDDLGGNETGDNDGGMPEACESYMENGGGMMNGGSMGGMMDGAGGMMGGRGRVGGTGGMMGRSWSGGYGCGM